jgi:hypothetical protein
LTPADALQFGQTNYILASSCAGSVTIGLGMPEGILEGKLLPNSCECSPFTPASMTLRAAPRCPTVPASGIKRLSVSNPTDRTESVPYRSAMPQLLPAELIARLHDIRDVATDLRLELIRATFYPSATTPQAMAGFIRDQTNAILKEVDSPGEG